MNPTKKVVQLLGARLADAVELQNRTKQAARNVQGASRRDFHDLFEKVNEGVDAYVELVARRLAQLGGHPDECAGAAAPPPVTTGRENADALSMALAEFGENVRAAVSASDRAGDPATADLFMEISRGVDNWLWFVESHVHRAW